MAKPVRRVVTGRRADGRSTVLIDAAAPNVKQRHAGNASTLLWVTGSFNAATACAVAAVVFAFRVIAWRRAWYVPLAVHGWHRRGIDAAAGPGGDAGGGPGAPRN